MRRLSNLRDPQGTQWEDCLDVLRAEGWDVDLDTYGCALLQLSGRVPDGKSFYLRGKYDFVELSIGGPDPADWDEWEDEITYERAGDLRGPQALPIIRELYGRYVSARAAHRDKWCLRGETTPLTGDQAADLVRRRLGELRLTTWFDHVDGPSLRIATNGVRAMITLSGTSNAGHAVTAGEPGNQGGYALENGLEGTYANQDTVPLEDAYTVMTCIIDYGNWIVCRGGVS